MKKGVHPDRNIGWDSIGRMEKFLTVSWNNWLSLGVGILVLIYLVFALSTSVLSGFPGYIGFVILGVLY